MKKILIIIPALLLTVSCTTTSKQEKLQTVEVSYLDLSQKQQKDLAEQYWLTKKAPNPHYPIQAAKENLSGCVELIVGINEQGELQGYKVRSSYPKGVFENSAIAALRQWRWEPAVTNPERKPILTSVRLDFATSKNPTGEAYLANCPKV